MVYTLSQKLGWRSQATFGHNMGDSPMVVVWPSRGAEGIYDFVTLSQRKAPYETMPTPDPNPPFAAQLDLSHTSVRLSPTVVVFCEFLCVF